MSVLGSWGPGVWRRGGLFIILIRRERRKNRQEQAKLQEEQFEQEVEAVDAGVETLAEAEENKAEKSEADCDNEDVEVKETTFESPSPEEIQQLTAEPKKLIEKKLE